MYSALFLCNWMVTHATMDRRGDSSPLHGCAGACPELFLHGAAKSAGKARAEGMFELHTICHVSGCCPLGCTVVSLERTVGLACVCACMNVTHTHF